MNLLNKLKETAISVIPIIFLVLLLGFTVVPLEKILLIRFVIGGVFLIIGLTFFLLGVDLGIQPMGERIGSELTHRRSLILLMISALFIGILVTVCEPDIQIFASQVKNTFHNLNKFYFILFIALGIGIFIMLGLLRSVIQFSLKFTFLISYVLIFILMLFSDSSFSAVAFDAGGATTGPMTVPFILALGLGVSSVRKSKENESFGLTGICSIGPVFSVLIYGLFLVSSNSGLSFKSINSSDLIQGTVFSSDNLFSLKNIFITFSDNFPHLLKDALISLSPILFLFFVFQIFLLKMSLRQCIRLMIGFTYSFIGLVIFLLGVNGGFIEAGTQLGFALGQKALHSGGLWFFLLIFTGFALGAIVVCAEPAVWVLTEQVEQVSSGTIRRKHLLIFLAIGSAFSIAFSLYRAVAGFDIRYILIPGYTLALLLMFFSPDLFTAIAFDSGGVATGPLTTTFILSFSLGAANNSAHNAQDAFGVIALVAMMPLIAVQILGIIFKIKKQKQIKEETDV